MRRTRWSLPVQGVVLALAVAAAAACEAIVNTSSLQDGVCPSGSKACNAQCVDVQDPNHHCGDTTKCLPCDIANAIAICDPAGACAIGTCSTVTNAMGAASEIWADCSNDASDGCEVDLLHDAKNCGSCGNVCSLSHVSETVCNGGACGILECVPGYLDCDSNPRDGCEVQSDGGECPDAG